MLKKIMLLALSLALVLCAASAFAEAAEEAEMHTLQVNKSFEIQSRIPEGYNFMPIVDTELNLVGLLKGGEDQPMVTVSIAYNDEYAEVERFNDVDETTVGLICDSFLELDDVSFEDLETAYGTAMNWSSSSPTTRKSPKPMCRCWWTSSATCSSSPWTENKS